MVGSWLMAQGVPGPPRGGVGGRKGCSLAKGFVPRLETPALGLRRPSAFPAGLGPRRPSAFSALWAPDQRLWAPCGLLASACWLQNGASWPRTSTCGFQNGARGLPTSACALQNKQIFTWHNFRIPSVDIANKKNTQHNLQNQCVDKAQFEKYKC